ncbi:MAG: hypothetical protein CSA84_05235 [Actinomycetales bacterium]|nr:MAG: hypothetical protein CSA84_05235 [Actinomycetales bacterium]
MPADAQEAVESRIRAATPPHSVRPWPLPIAESAHVDAIARRLAACTDDAQLAQAEDDLSSQLQMQGTPLWEPADERHSRVTFVWIGDAPHGVALYLNRFCDVMDIADTLMARLGTSRVHALTLRVPHSLLSSYLFIPLPHPPSVVLHRGVDPERMQPLLAAACEDPLAGSHIVNKLVIPGRQATPRLAVAAGPAAMRRRLWEDEPVETIPVRSLRGTYTDVELSLSVWSHPDCDVTSPVFLLTDGEVWREQFPIASELCRLVQAGRLAPMHVVFLDSGGARQRQLDYPASPPQSGRMLEQIRDHVAGHVGQGPWIVAGQSLGGLFALLCATRHPDLVAAAVGQSPSLWWPAIDPNDLSTNPYATRVEPNCQWNSAIPPRRGWFQELAEARDPAPVLIESGRYDWVLVDRLRDAAALLDSQGALIGYDEPAAGHDVLQWQASLPDLLCRAFSHVSEPRASGERG